MRQLNYFLTLYCISDKYTVETYKNYISSFMSIGSKCLRLNPAHSTVEEAGQSVKIMKEYFKEIGDCSTLTEVCIPHTNAKPRINIPPKELCREYKKGEIIKLYKTLKENEFSGDLRHLDISVGKKLTWGDFIGLFEIVEDNEEYVTLKFNIDKKMPDTRKPVVVLDSVTKRDYSLSTRDLSLIDESIKNGADIISCSFSTDKEVIEDYLMRIKEASDKYTKNPLIILKLEESGFVSKDNLEYLKSIKHKFNGLSISRGDLFCNEGTKAPTYESILLDFAKIENIPIRVYTLIGENWNGVFSRNDSSCLYSYIKRGVDMIGLSDESIYLDPFTVKCMIDEIEDIAYNCLNFALDSNSEGVLYTEASRSSRLISALTEKELLDETGYNNIKFLVPIKFDGVFRNKDLYINCFDNVEDYYKYCLFKGTIMKNNSK